MHYGFSQTNERLVCACIFRQDELYDIWAKHSRHETQYSNGAVYVRSVFGDLHTRLEYAQMCLLPKQTIHTVVQELEQAGYLEKVSVSGRKEKPLRLTESGKRYTADKLCGLYRAEERAAAAMGAEQFAAMVEMTRKFTDSFEKEIRNGAE